MEIRVRTPGKPTRSVVERLVALRARFALDRQAADLRRVTLSLVEEGTSGGHRCVVHVDLRRGGKPLVARAVGDTVNEAVATALTRARRRVSRSLEPHVAWGA